MIKIKDFLRDNQEEKKENRIVTKWTKIEIVIPTGMKYRYDTHISYFKSSSLSVFYGFCSLVNSDFEREKIRYLEKDAFYYKH